MRKLLTNAIVMVVTIVLTLSFWGLYPTVQSAELSETIAVVSADK